jgi:hypothetical protein
MADEKRTVVLDFEVDIGDNEQSIQQLVKANKALREERNKLNTQTEDGRKKIADLNAAIDKNNSTIKANSSALEKQRQNVGNYAGAIDRLVPGLGQIAAGLENMAGGFISSAKAALAFIATPIGAVLAGIVAALSLLKAAISTNNDVLDKFENVTSAIGTILEVLLNRVGKLGEALLLAFSGDFSGALDKTSEAFTGIADEIGRAVEEGQKLLDLSRDLEDAQRDLRVEQAKQENVIKALVVSAKNRNLSFDEQEARIRRALQLEEALVKTREDLARRELVIYARTIANEKNLRQTSEETFEQFVDRLRHTQTLGDEFVDGLVEKIQALESARGSSLAFQEKLENSLAAIQEKRVAAAEKEAAEREKILALQDEERRAAAKRQEEVQKAINDNLLLSFEAQNKVENAAQDALDEESNRLIAEGTLKIKFNKDTNDAIAKENAEFRTEQEEFEKKSTALYVQQQNLRLNVATTTLANIASALDKESAAYKVIASLNALINTYRAANAALATGSEINPIFGIISAAAAVAAGLANVAKINGIEFAEGGYTGQGSRLEPAGIVHKGEYVVPKWQVENPQYSHHLAALESGRSRGYADGGLVSAGIVGSSGANIDIMSAIKALPAPVVSVKEFNIVQKRVQVKEQVSQV